MNLVQGETVFTQYILWRSAQPVSSVYLPQWHWKSGLLMNHWLPKSKKFLEIWWKQVLQEGKIMCYWEWGFPAGVIHHNQQPQGTVKDGVRTKLTSNKNLSGNGAICVGLLLLLCGSSLYVQYWYNSAGRVLCSPAQRGFFLCIKGGRLR